MTDPSHEDGLFEDEQPVDQDSPQTYEDMSVFSSGEGMVALAGIMLIGVWFLFEVIIEEYSISTLAVVVAGIAAILPRLNPDSVNKVISLPTAMKLLGYTLLLIGIVEIVTDIRIGILDNSAWTLIGALIAYGAYALALIGARSIED